MNNAMPGKYSGDLNRSFSDLRDGDRFKSPDDLVAWFNINRPDSKFAESKVAKALFDACELYKVPIWYAFGTFYQESSLFTPQGQKASRYNNPGCMMPEGKLANYNSPEEGVYKNVENMARLINQGYDTPEKVLNKWHPITPGPHQAANIARMPEYRNNLLKAAALFGVSGITKK
jgi:hypothetical protein